MVLMAAGGMTNKANRGEAGSGPDQGRALAAAVCGRGMLLHHVK